MNSLEPFFNPDTILVHVLFVWQPLDMESDRSY